MPAPAFDDLTMRLGSVEFVDKEIPNNLGDLGGKQEMVVFRFPGGQTSVQFLGAFGEDKEWQGILWGPTAIQRAHELEQLYVNPEGIHLRYASWDWFGVVAFFKVLAEHQNHLVYTIRFVVVEDQSNGQGLAGPAPAPEQLLAQMQSVANAQTQLSPTGYVFPSSVKNQVNNIQQAISQAMAGAGGLIANLSAAQIGTLQGLITGAIGGLRTLQGGATSLGVAAAGDLIATLKIMSNTLNPASAVLTTITQTNPNLSQLAAVYYEDASLWKVIAKANNLTDPQPLGTYTLKIPALAANQQVPQSL